ncbi:unnamed protein product [Adineta ricciae]|uniref:PARP catalytic domain-containing protein n=1 Tax=Adineta ricciae TaxID=249248 RepID=A0A815G6Q3_ADIRI|nr:unnamed protein product [Adineta ricciae]CAF1334522.1 unnamed protein product [Adineta ricciae]
MCSHSCFYRSLVYLHVLIAIFESATTIGLFVLISITHQELFFKTKHPEDGDLQAVGTINIIIIFVLFLAGAIRTIILLVFVFLVLLMPSVCFCMLCIPHCRNPYCKLLRSRSTNRFLSFNCNCPCYRARPKLRFQMQFILIIFISCIRIAMIIFCFTIQHNIATKSLAVIVAISFFFLIITSLLDFYHYRVWWHYKPILSKTTEHVEIPTAPLSKKHQRFIPYHLLGDNRTTHFGDKACSNNRCQNRDLEHIFIFHFKGYNPQPRYFDLDERTRYIGFHQTDPESAIQIAHSDFRISVKHECSMLGHGVYFARSREGTDRKANRQGAFICAEINMGRVLRVNAHERNLYRGKKDWWTTHDSAYFCHPDAAFDEFCIKDPSQILKWIMVIEKNDSKVELYGLDQEFDDTKCSCI